MNLADLKIGVVGLGYVGLPLAVEFGKKFPTYGFDIKSDRVRELKEGRDSTLECEEKELAEAVHLTYTDSLEDIKQCNFTLLQFLLLLRMIKHQILLH